MPNGKAVEHLGTVESVAKDTLLVAISVGSACGKCQAKGFCGAGTDGDRSIEVRNPSGSYRVGERVVVRMKPQLGFKASILAYLIPFLVCFISLILSIIIFRNEAMAGLVSLCATGLYFFALSFFKDRLQKEFVFEVAKTEGIVGDCNTSAALSSGNMLD